MSGDGDVEEDFSSLLFANEHWSREARNTVYAVETGRGRFLVGEFSKAGKVIIQTAWSNGEN